MSQTSGCQEQRRLGRRSFLQVGGLGAFGLSLSHLLQQRAAAAPHATPSAKAKSVILYWLQGGVTHHETFDPKPQAPIDVRGEFGTIDTSLPGVRICELMPKMAQQMNRISVIRSVTHHEAAHERGMRYMLSCRQPDPGSPPPRNHPDVAAIVAHELGMRNGLPPYVILPGSDFTANIQHYAAGFLPVSAQPFYGKNSGVFSAPTADAARFQERLALRKDVDSLTRSRMSDVDTIKPWDELTLQAAELVTTGRARAAFDLSLESASMREHYGITAAGGKAGQRVEMGEFSLQARRLVEAGVRFVTIGRDSWDHHSNIMPQVKSRVPQFDHSFNALLTDLEQRGLLAETLVVYLSEFGRTPKINKDGGRDHWPGAFSVAFAGAGIKPGQVIGASDAQGGYPIERPVTPEEIAATILQLVGISPTADYIGSDKRPLPYVQKNAQVIGELLS